MREHWNRCVAEPAREAGLPVPRLLAKSSPYRSVLALLLRKIAGLQAAHPGRAIPVVLPQLVVGRCWESLLHTRRERRLRTTLLRRGGPSVAVVGVPWQIARPQEQKAPAEETDEA